jgi:ElaB/YqjD/DUF883 family membrane-anchored ribosome-binding protein
LIFSAKKGKHNKIIDDIMIDVRRLSSEALEMMSQANENSTKAEERTINERKCASAQLHEERAHNSRESARLRQKIVTAAGGASGCTTMVMVFVR